PPGGCRTVAWSNDGERVLIVDGFNQLFEIDLTAGVTPERVETPIHGKLTHARWIGSTLMLDEQVDGARQLRFVDADGQDDVVVLPDGLDCAARSSQYAAVAEAHRLHVVDLSTHEIRTTIEAPGQITACSVSPDGLRVAAAVDGFGI